MKCQIAGTEEKVRDIKNKEDCTCLIKVLAGKKRNKAKATFEIPELLKLFRTVKIQCS